MAVSKMPFGVSCVSFEGPPRQSKASFECYLQYFRRVHRLHRHEGYIFPEGLLGGSREPFGNHLRGLGVSSGVPGSLLVLSWRLLGVSQGVLAKFSGSVLVVSSCIMLQLLAFFLQTKELADEWGSYLVSIELTLEFKISRSQLSLGT